LEILACGICDCGGLRTKAVQERYALSHTREAGYITRTWLDRYKEKFVRAWVDQRTHFENVVTSRDEGIRQLIKIHMKTSQLDLFDAWRSIKRAVLNQTTSLRENQAKQRTSVYGTDSTQKSLSHGSLLYGVWCTNLESSSGITPLFQA
jgi:hypothetical protein